MEIIKAILVNLVVPVVGLQIFVTLKGNMRAAQIERPPVIPLFINFVTYGGWVMVALTLLIWHWSGMALIGLLYLVFIGPFLMSGLAVMMYRQRRFSRYHFGLFVSSAIYPCIIGLLILGRALVS